MIYNKNVQSAYGKHCCDSNDEECHELMIHVAEDVPSAWDSWDFDADCLLYS